MPVQKVPKLKVCAPHMSTHAENHILQTGCKNLTFNQLAMDSPKHFDITLISSKTSEVHRHFSKAQGITINKTKPNVHSEDRSLSALEVQGATIATKTNPDPTLLLNILEESINQSINQAGILTKMVGFCSNSKEVMRISQGREKAVKYQKCLKALIGSLQLPLPTLRTPLNKPFYFSCCQREHPLSLPLCIVSHIKTSHGHI